MKILFISIVFSLFLSFCVAGLIIPFYHAEAESVGSSGSAADITFVGTSCASCSTPVKISSGQYTLSCATGKSKQFQNTVSFVPDTYSMVVNGQAMPCQIGKEPAFPPRFPCDRRPSGLAKLNWLYSDNLFGKLGHIYCNVPKLSYASGIYPEGTLLSANPQPTKAHHIYVIENGKKRHIDSSLFSACGINLADVLQIAQDYLDLIPSSQNITSCPWANNLNPITVAGITDTYENQLVTPSGTNHVYLIERKTKRWITDLNTLSKCFGVPLINAVSSSDLEQVAPGKDIWSCNWYSDGTVLSDGSATQWVIENGKKRKVVLPQEASCSFSQNPAYTLTSEVLSKIPRGENLTSCQWFQTGSVVSSATSEHQYYIQKGEKRQISNAKTFNECGLYWNDIINTTKANLNGIASGNVVSACPPSDNVRRLGADLWAYYPFNVNGNDRSSLIDVEDQDIEDLTGNNATVSYETTYGPGVQGNALYFMETGAYATLPSVSETLTDQSMSLWIKVPSSPPPTMKSSPTGLIVGYSETNSSLGLGYFTFTKERMLTSALQCANGPTWFRVPMMSIKAETWTHVAVVYNYQDTTLKIYLKGKEVYSRDDIYCGPNNYTLKPMWGNNIGGASSASSNYVVFGGAIDEVFLYKKALTANEVLALSTLPPSTPNSGSHWMRTFESGSCGGYQQKACFNKGKCIQHWFFIPLDFFCMGHEEGYYSCSEGLRVDDENTCQCPRGTERSDNVCVPNNLPTVVSEGIAINGVKTKGIYLKIYNPQNATFFVPDDHAIPNRKKIASFVKKSCTEGDSNQAKVCTSIDLQKQCQTEGCECRKLGLSKVTSKGSILYANMPYLTLEEWHNQLLKSQPTKFTRSTRHILINANFFDPKMTGPCSIPMHKLISDGSLVANWPGDTTLCPIASLVVYENNQLDVVSNPSDDVKIAISGIELIKPVGGKGVIAGSCPRSSPYGSPANRRGRTAVGLDSDGKLHILAIPDPQYTKKNAGATYSQLANYMIGKGVIKAVMLDGGGSTALYDWAPNSTAFGKVKITKTPPGKGGKEYRPIPAIFSVIVPK